MVWIDDGDTTLGTAWETFEHGLAVASDGGFVAGGGEGCLVFLLFFRSFPSSFFFYFSLGLQISGFPVLFEFGDGDLNSRFQNWFGHGLI
jgi:hypothetical protein